jgi:sugar phosphate isomerase/epimerase
MMNNPSRREFVRTTLAGGAGLMAASSLVSAPPAIAHDRPTKDAVSLATWSIVRSFRAGIWKLPDVARICREDFGIDGIEYVTSFFEAPVESYLKRLNQAAADHGVANVLIMVDGEGDMVSRDRSVRMQAAINHRKWVDVAGILGCHAIRCNARGAGETPEADPDAVDRAAEAFGALIEYAEPFGINIVIENHGGISSDPRWLPELMKKVDSPHFGTLPDYGNFTEIEGVDVYEALRMAMPYAKGVSVKAGFEPDGSHPRYDLEKLLKISKDAGYTGYWGVESSIRRDRDAGPRSPSAIMRDDWQAVRWTKAAIDKVVFGKA